jgi:hypothetical protein
VLLDRVTEPAGYAVDHALETRVAKRFDLAAVPADEMVMVGPACRSRLEARDPVAGVDALHEAKLDQRLQSAVHRRDADRPAGPTELVEDLLGAQTAVLPSKQFDYRPARAAPAIARYGERVECPCGPCVRLRRHES